MRLEKNHVNILLNGFENFECFVLFILALKSRLPDQLPEHIKDGLSKYSGVGDVTTVLPTVWMGSQNGQ